MRNILLAALFAAGTLAAQHTPIIDASTPEGQALQKIGQEADDAKKTPLLEEFVTTYPASPSIGWVYEQLQPAYVKAGKFDEALSLGDKLLALNGDDTEAALQNLKAAEGKKDLALVLKWSDRTDQNAKKALAAPEPKDADELDNWKKHQEYAKQVAQYTEYSLFAAALQSTDPKKKLELVNALRTRNGKSQYLPQMAQQEFLAYRQMGDNAKAVALAENILATDQTNEDMLLVVTDSYMQKKINADKVLTYSTKMVDVMSAKPKPEGVSDADWDKRKNLIIGLGHQWSGKTYMDQNKFAQADKELRLALPMISGDNNLKGETTFLLGLANYKMKKIPEAIRFNQMCAAIRSPYQAQAEKNIKAMQSGK